MIDPSLGFSLREKMDALPIDWRNAYLGFDARGKPCGWPGSAAELAGVPTITVSAELVVETPLEALRESPSHRAGLLSEARMGELFQLIQERGEWSLVAGEDGYVAWMRSWSSRKLSQREKEELLSRRIGLFEPVLGTFDARDGMCQALLRGTPLLQVEDTRLDSSPISVGLVDGTRGRLPLQAVRSSPPRRRCPRWWGRPVGTWARRTGGEAGVLWDWIAADIPSSSLARAGSFSPVMPCSRQVVGARSPRTLRAGNRATSSSSTSRWTMSRFGPEAAHSFTRGFGSASRRARNSPSSWTPSSR